VRWPWTKRDLLVDAFNRSSVYQHEMVERMEKQHAELVAKNQAMHEAVKQLVTAQWETNSTLLKLLEMGKAPKKKAGRRK